MSLDGYTAGPQQSKKNPLGIGGMRLHEWAFSLAAWRAIQGLKGGEVNESTRVVEESLANIGATIMGRCALPFMPAARPAAGSDPCAPPATPRTSAAPDSGNG
jgi:hypothetical protein